MSRDAVATATAQFYERTGPVDITKRTMIFGTADKEPHVERHRRRRAQVDQRLRDALKSSGGRIVILDIFPNFNDRKLARRIAEADQCLQYFSPGRPRPAVISVITNGVQP